MKLGLQSRKPFMIFAVGLETDMSITFDMNGDQMEYTSVSLAGHIEGKFTFKVRTFEQ